jgi:DNA-binding HxlR family transcriptional regulator
LRSGSLALSLLSTPINVRVLTALEQKPLPLTELRRAIGSPPQTTTRGHLRVLTEMDVLVRRRERGSPGTASYELGTAGGELLRVARTLDSWLATNQDLMPLGSSEGRSALKSLVAGWDSMIIRALAARPLSLTELNNVIPRLNYPSLERRLTGLRSSGLVKPQSGDGRSTPYGVTAWMRKAVGPIVAAARWERERVPEEATPPGRLDIEALFLLTVPRLELPDAGEGCFRLGMEVRANSGELRLAGVQARFAEGRVEQCTTRLNGRPDACATGPAGAWLRALAAGEFDGLDLSGDRGFANAVVEALHAEIFRIPQRA